MHTKKKLTCKQPHATFSLHLILVESRGHGLRGCWNTTKSCSACRDQSVGWFSPVSGPWKPQNLTSKFSPPLLWFLTRGHLFAKEIFGHPSQESVFWAKLPFRLDFPQLGLSNEVQNVQIGNKVRIFVGDRHSFCRPPSPNLSLSFKHGSKFSKRVSNPKRKHKRVW